jgi:hypothetical protein
MTRPEMTMGMKNMVRNPVCHLILEFSASASSMAVTLTTMVATTANSRVNP